MLRSRRGKWMAIYNLLLLHRWAYNALDDGHKMSDAEKSKLVDITSEPEQPANANNKQIIHLNKTSKEEVQVSGAAGAKFPPPIPPHRRWGVRNRGWLSRSSHPSTNPPNKTTMSQTTELQGLPNQPFPDEKTGKNMPDKPKFNPVNFHFDLPCSCPKPHKIAKWTGKKKGWFAEYRWNPSPTGWNYEVERYYESATTPEELWELRKDLDELRAEWATIRNYYLDFVPADCDYIYENFVTDDKGELVFGQDGSALPKHKQSSYEKFLGIKDNKVNLWERPAALPKKEDIPMKKYEGFYRGGAEFPIKYETWKWETFNPLRLTEDELSEVYDSPTGKPSDTLWRGRTNQQNNFKFNPRDFDLKEPSRIELILAALNDKGWVVKE